MSRVGCLYNGIASYKKNNSIIEKEERRGREARRGSVM